MSFVVSCQCGKQFRVADEQMGKQSRCKGCGTVLHLVPDADPEAEAAAPRADYDADPFATVDWNATDVDAGAAPAYAPPAGGGAPPPPPMPKPVMAAGPQQKACPNCGSLISAFAIRCEHCNANLLGGGGPVPAARTSGPGKLAYAAGSDDSDLTVVDWLLCIVCSGIGCIVGIVYLVQGKPKGGKMIGISLLVGFVSGGIRQYLRQRSIAP